MPSDLNRLLAKLSRDQLRDLLAAKEEIEGLEGRRAELQEELAAIEKQLQRLLGKTIGGRTGARRAKKTVKKSAKKAAKKSAPKTAKKAAKKTAKKTARRTAKKSVKKSAQKTAEKPIKKTGKKTVKKVGKRSPRPGVRKTAKQTTRESVPRPAAGGPRVKLEDVVVNILEQHGGPMPFKQILETIVTGELFTSRSANFDNVLRRTVSTSEKIKRVSRGVYGL
jgi:DNA repair exonuclease SbcCD ATPase subunit